MKSDDRIIVLRDGRRDDENGCKAHMNEANLIKKVQTRVGMILASSFYKINQTQTSYNCSIVHFCKVWLFYVVILIDIIPSTGYH